MKLFQYIVRLCVFFSSAALLTACSSGDDTTTPVTATITTASATLEFDIKTFRFTWTDVPDAIYYRLLENPDGSSGFSQVGSDIAQGTQTFVHPVSLYNRINAVYILQTCNSIGCIDGSSINVAGSLAVAIGYIKASNTAGDDLFGAAVSLSNDGNTLAVGATGEASSATGIGGNQADDTAAAAGAVYVFSRIGNTWSQQAYIKASNTGAADNFGQTVSLSDDGNTLAVGASFEASSATGIGGNQADDTTAAAGAVYVFNRSGTTWSQQAYIKASNTGVGDLFGRVVNLSNDGNTLAVGASFEASSATGIGGNQADDTAIFSGAVYVFSRSGTTWSQQTYIKASNTGAVDLFGEAISLSNDGNTLAVGATGEASSATGIGGNQANNSANNAGAVYVFSRSGNTWSQQAYIKASNTGAADNFGQAVGLSDDGNTLAVGATGEASSATGIGGNQADNSANNAGAVYVFSRNGTTWSQQAYIKAGNTAVDDLFGGAVSLSNDGNTLAVGATNEASSATGISGNQADNSANNAGAVYVFRRSGATWSQQAYIKASNTAAGDLFGEAVSLSNDGFTLAVGAIGEASSATGIGGNQADETANNAGAVYLY